MTTTSGPSHDGARRARGAHGVTLKDVAAAASVHPSTASRALDPLKVHMVGADTRARVQQEARRLGYRTHHVAQSLRRGTTGTVGVVVADLGNSFVAKFVHGVAGRLDEDAVVPLIGETEDVPGRFERIAEHLLSRRVDALIVAAARFGDGPVLERIARAVPVVLAIREVPGCSFPTVTHDDEAGGRLAARALHQAGHRRVAQLLGPMDVGNFVARQRGFSRYCRDVGMDELTLDVAAERPVLEEGERLMRGLLATEPKAPLALFAHNDLMAVGALKVLRERGWRCPEDVSLIGYNDLPIIGQLDPPLASIRFPSEEIGEAAAAVALGILTGDDGVRRSKFPARLLPRASIGAVRA